MEAFVCLFGTAATVIGFLITGAAWEVASALRTIARYLKQAVEKKAE